MDENLKNFIKRNIFLIILLALIVSLFTMYIMSGPKVEETVLQVAETPPQVGGEVRIEIAKPPPEALRELEARKQREAAMENYKDYILNKEHNFGHFETNLKSVGFYTYKDAYGDEVTEFRADIWVKNVGEAEQDFLWEKAYILEIPNQKYNLTGGEFDGNLIQPGEEREGYLLFAGAPTALPLDLRIVIGNSVSYSAIMGFTTQVPHTYEIELE